MTWLVNAYWSRAWPAAALPASTRAQARVKRGRRRAELPKAAVYFFDVTPRQLVNIKGLGLTDGYCKRLARFRYGPGVYKMDWALKEPIPWKADVCRKAGTVHLGGSYGEIAASIREVRAGNLSPSPYIILAQQSLFDPSRAPAGRHTA